MIRFKKKTIYIFGIRGFPKIIGGAEKHCEKLYRRIAKYNFDVRVFRRKPYVVIQSKCYKYRLITFYDYWTLKNKYFEVIIHSFLSTLKCIIDRPDLVHIHNMGASIFIPLLKITGIKVVATYHSRNYLHKKWGLLAIFLFKIGELFIKTMADKVIYISPQYKHILPPKKRVFIPNGVSITKSSHSDKNILTHLHILPDQYILFVGRIEQEKGVHDLINAFKRLKTTFKLIIAGNANYNGKYLQSILALANGNDKIVLPGYITEEALYQLYTNARLFVLPSHQEGLSIALLEAMSYGLSVLVSDIPANIEIDIKKERFFKCGDINDLKEKMEILLANTISTNEKKKYIFQIKNIYNWEKIAQQTIKVYETTLEK